MPRSLLRQPVRVLFFLGLALAAAGCDGGKSQAPAPVCADQSVVAKPPSGYKNFHHPARVAGSVPANVDSLDFKLAPKDSVAAFFGGKRVKITFVIGGDLWLVSYDVGEPVASMLSEDDEGADLKHAQPNSPLFSPDGGKLAYAGALFGKTIVSFVRQALPGGTPAWRVPVDTTGVTAAEPHWVEDSGKTWIYFVSTPDRVFWDNKCAQLGGGTWRAQLLNDSTFGSVEATGWPGAFKGGLSKDHAWAGTTFSPTALYELAAKKTTILAGGVQQCNPSMNPFPAGSARADYLMILAFGGKQQAVGGPVDEGQHENLWIYNKDDKIVWQGRRPDETKYAQWQKPEWSTHPEFATAVALYRVNTGSVVKGDLYAVRIGDLANNDESALKQAQGYLKLAEGGFTESSWSHLWVEP